MLELKRMETGVEEMCQTFTILDQLPNGMQKYVNLRNLTGGKAEEVLVTKYTIFNEVRIKCNSF